ncbi:hypothetical protein [Devosia sp. YR412]|uniref:hypothetical protein n=1 Tax=Devosia sp. YR412 TaxID=1881030 RepID=UPI001114531E|nr:hypothetical protein [Devosia sp. YR412]
MQRHDHLLLAVALASVFVVAAPVLAQAPAPTSAATEVVSLWLAPPNVVTPEGLPTLGKWMLTSAGVPSDWLGEVYRGKNLREPINVIIVDDAATSAADAITRLIAASTSAGYPVRQGHSTGYQAAMDGGLHAQLPTGNDVAFSNGIYELDNNHGRIFGPVALGTSFVFIGAFSREDVDPLADPGHQYGSFNQARDDFTQKLDAATDFKVSQFVDMENAILDDPKLTTVEHDGMAVLVRASK